MKGNEISFVRYFQDLVSSFSIIPSKVLDFRDDCFDIPTTVVLNNAPGINTRYNDFKLFAPGVMS